MKLSDLAIAGGASVLLAVVAGALWRIANGDPGQGLLYAAALLIAGALLRALKA